MKSVGLAIFLTFAAAGFTHAKTLAIPDDNPIATVALPDSWGLDDLDDGIEAMSRDELVYVAVEAGAPTDPRSAAMSAASRLFEDKGIVADTESVVETECTTRGMPCMQLAFQGYDEDGPTSVVVAVVTVSDEGMLILTRWAPENLQPDDSVDMGRIIDSIQVAADPVVDP